MPSFSFMLKATDHSLLGRIALIGKKTNSKKTKSCPLRTAIDCKKWDPEIAVTRELSPLNLIVTNACYILCFESPFSRSVTRGILTGYKR